MTMDAESRKIADTAAIVAGKTVSSTTHLRNPDDDYEGQPPLFGASDAFAVGVTSTCLGIALAMWWP